MNRYAWRVAASVTVLSAVLSDTDFFYVAGGPGAGFDLTPSGPDFTYASLLGLPGMQLGLNAPAGTNGDRLASLTITPFVDFLMIGTAKGTVGPYDFYDRFKIYSLTVETNETTGGETTGGETTGGETTGGGSTGGEVPEPASLVLLGSRRPATPHPQVVRSQALPSPGWSPGDGSAGGYGFDVAGATIAACLQTPPRLTCSRGQSPRIAPRPRHRRRSTRAPQPACRPASPRTSSSFRRTRSI